MKEVLVITSYFPPETGAASNRIYHLAEGLKKRGFKPSIVTPLPNYPTGKIFKEYIGKFKQTTEENGLKVHRLWLYASNSKNKLIRLFAMLSYSVSLFWFIMTHKIPKRVIVQSPPLLVAFTCMLLLSKKRHLVLNVSDLWPIAGLELGAFKKNFSYKMLEKIEHYNYKKATLVMGQSEEILTHVASIAPLQNTFLYRNYPEFKLPELAQGSANSNKIKMVYAGLLGIAQGIFKLCENLDYSNIEFHIYGTGAEAEKVSEFIKQNPDLPITYYGQVQRSELHGVLLNYDVTIIPLLNRIYGSVPSKIFEYSKLGLPMVYFGGGEGESIITENHLGWVVNAADYTELNRIIATLKVSDFSLEKKKAIQQIAFKNFNSKGQLEALANHLF